MSMDDPLEELTYKRPTNYSQWHRKALPARCYMTDGDWFEQRAIRGTLKSVAYIECIEFVPVAGADKARPVWDHKKSLCLEIEHGMGIPAYVVWHNPECTDFLVLRITETKPKRMNESEYKEFIKGL